MKYLLHTASLISMLTVANLHADWTVVSTFDDESELAKVSDQTNREGSNARSEIVDGKWAVFPGDLLEQTSNLHAFLDLGVDLYAESTAGGHPVTLYFEVIQPIVEGQKAIVDTVWGLANIEPETVFDDGNGYNSFNAMQRIEAGSDGYQGYHGAEGGYEDVLTPDGSAAQLIGDQTYQVWLVLDYTLGVYEVYVQGGQWEEQTRIGTQNTEGFWGFRTNPDPTAHTVDHFLVSLSRGNSVDGEKGIDPTYFDNVAYDVSGQNLTVPVSGGGQSGPGVFARYDVDDGGWLFADDFLGWANVTNYPWVFHLTSGGWVYVDNTGDPEGNVWVYHVRN